MKLSAPLSDFISSESDTNTSSLDDDNRETAGENTGFDLLLWQNLAVIEPLAWLQRGRGFNSLEDQAETP